MACVNRNVVAAVLVLNLAMCAVVIGFASWHLNHLINGTSNRLGVAAPMGGNGATFYFLIFAILAGVVGAASKLAGVHHVRTWRGDGQAAAAAAAASALVAWAITALAFGLACKEIHIGGKRGWRLRVLEAFVIILAVTQLLYVMVLHAGLYGNQLGGGGGGYDAGEHHDKGMGTGATGV